MGAEAGIGEIERRGIDVQARRHGEAYLLRMAILPPIARPKDLIRDMRVFVAGDRRHKLVFATLAVGVTSLIVTALIVESWYGIQPEGQQITYAENFDANRTDAEIIAQQKIDQAARDKAKAEKQAAFKRLDDKLTKYGF